MGNNDTGRPVKLTPAMHDALVAHIRAGNYLRAAASACDVDESTVYDWIRRGRRPEEVAQDSIFAQFSQAMERAQGESELFLVKAVEAAAQGMRLTRTMRVTKDGVEVTHHEERVVQDWRAGAWLLERRHPERWALRETKGEEEKQPPVKVLILPSEPPPLTLPAAGPANRLEPLKEPETMGDFFGD